MAQLPTQHVLHVIEDTNQVSVSFVHALWIWVCHLGQKACVLTPDGIVHDIAFENRGQFSDFGTKCQCITSVQSVCSKVPSHT